MTPAHTVRVQRFVSLLTLAMLVISRCGPPTLSGARAASGALQKAIWFYEAQVSGPKPAWNRVAWRGNATMMDGTEHNIDLAGGWFDAGNHVKAVDE